MSFIINVINKFEHIKNRPLKFGNQIMISKFTSSKIFERILKTYIDK